jgi:hypothetical protein
MAKDNGQKPQTIKRIFLKIQVYPNRVEITEGMFPYRRKSAIPMHNIAEVAVSKATRALIIRTNDGKEKKLMVGRKVYKARDTIIENM